MKCIRSGTLCRLCLTLMLVFIVPSVSIAADCQKSQVIGQVDAGQKHGSAGWVVAGIGSGILLGLIGTGAITALSFISSPTPKEIRDDSAYDVSCYVNGYKKAARKKNALSALSGGLIGTLAFVVYYSSTQN